MPNEKKISVLIVDDSAIVRQVMSEIINSDPMLEVMATAADPFYAALKLRKEIPDVIILDVEMPRMDGLTFLKKIMSQHPIPVVMCSSLTEQGSETVFKALEYGAVDIITKPKLGVKQFIDESKIRICDTIKAASKACVKRKKVRATQQREIPKKLNADVIPSKSTSSNSGFNSIVISKL